MFDPDWFVVLSTIIHFAVGHIFRYKIFMNSWFSLFLFLRVFAPWAYPFSWFVINWLTVSYELWHTCKCENSFCRELFHGNRELYEVNVVYSLPAFYMWSSKWCWTWTSIHTGHKTENVNETENQNEKRNEIFSAQMPRTKRERRKINNFLLPIPSPLVYFIVACEFTYLTKHN